MIPYMASDTPLLCHGILPLIAIHRVTTHLENLEKSGNSKVVRENGKSREMKSGEFFQDC